MKRPLVWMAAALVLGEWMGQFGRNICMVFFSISAAGLLLGGIWVHCRGRHPAVVRELFYRKTLYVLPFVFLFGNWSVNQARSTMEAVQVQITSGMETVLTGTILQEEPDGTALRLTVRVQSWDTEIQSPWLVQIQTEESPQLADGSLRYPIGSIIRAEGWLYLFPKAMNPGQFDTRNYYAGKNIAAGMQAKQLTVLHPGSRQLANRLLLVRLHLAEVLNRVCEGTDIGFFQAMVLGMSRQVDAEQKGLFQAAGIAHLLSISGLHISCLAMAVYQFCRKRSGSYLLAMAGGSLFLVLYGMMIGGSASALRAMAMFALQMLAAYHGRKYDILSAAAAAAIGILLEYPIQLWQSGFWMTFLAILGIGVLYPALTAFWKAGRIAKAVLFSLSVQAAVLPAVLYSSFCYPVYSVLINLFVVPFAGYLLFSGAASALVGSLRIGWGVFFAGTGHTILWGYTLLCRWMQRLPYGSMVMGRPHPWQCLLYYGLLLGFVRFMQVWIREEAEEAEAIDEKKRRRERLERKLRAVGSLVIFLGLYSLLGSYSDEKLHVTMLDVGQGECIHIRTPEEQEILIDGGSTDTEQVGTYRILPYLLSQGIDELDLLVLTHPDADHTNGIREVIEDGRIRIRAFCMPDPEKEQKWQELLQLAEDCQAVVYGMKAGERFVTGETVFSCLHPYAGSTETDSNAGSLVLRMDYRDSSMLFTGDLPAEAEDFLQEIEAVDVLKAAHHGSKYANSAKLLARCMPKLAVISCGAGNRYGHPHEEVLERLTDIGCDYFITAGQGALLLETDGEIWRMEQFGCKESSLEY